MFLGFAWLQVLLHSACYVLAFLIEVTSGTGFLHILCVHYLRITPCIRQWLSPFGFFPNLLTWIHDLSATELHSGRETVPLQAEHAVGSTLLAERPCHMPVSAWDPHLCLCSPGQNECCSNVTMSETAQLFVLAICLFAFRWFVLRQSLV